LTSRIINLKQLRLGFLANHQNETEKLYEFFKFIEFLNLVLDIIFNFYDDYLHIQALNHYGSEDLMQVRSVGMSPQNHSNGYQELGILDK